MTSVVFPALGWLAALALLAAMTSAVVRGFRGMWADKRLHPLTPGRTGSGPWIAAGMYACAAMAMLGLLGAVRPSAAAPLALLAAAGAAGVALKAHGKDAARQALGHAGAGFGYLARDARNLRRRIGGRLAEPGTGGDGSGPELETVAAAVASRAIPSLRDDPALGVPPEPAAIASTAPVPAPYAALATYVAGFEAGDDQDLRMFTEGCAAGNVALAEAWHQFADRCLDSRLHPAYVAGVLEVGDHEAEGAAHKVQVHRRFAVIYGAVKNWISGNGPLPKDGDFLTGEDAA